MLPPLSITNTHGSVWKPQALKARAGLAGLRVGYSSTWMKLALAAPIWRKASSCSSTTGPHMRLWHSSGVANETTVGLPERSALSSDTECMVQGGVRVQILARPAGLVATGVGSDSALLPIAPMTFWLTGAAPWPATRWPLRSLTATISQLPVVGASTSAP